MVASLQLVSQHCCIFCSLRLPISPFSLWLSNLSSLPSQILPPAPTSFFTTDYLSCLTEKSKAFKWETPQFTAMESPNLMFCLYSWPAFQLTVEEITFLYKAVFLLMFDSFVLVGKLCKKVWFCFVLF